MTRHGQFRYPGLETYNTVTSLLQWLDYDNMGGLIISFMHSFGQYYPVVLIPQSQHANHLAQNKNVRLQRPTSNKPTKNSCTSQNKSAFKSLLWHASKAQMKTIVMKLLGLERSISTWWKRCLIFSHEWVGERVAQY